MPDDALITEPKASESAKPEEGPEQERPIVATETDDGSTTSLTDGFVKPKRRWWSVFKLRSVQIGIGGVILAASGGWLVGYWLLGAPGPVKPVGPVARFAAVAEPFRIVATSPSDGQTGVVADTPITITFNKPVDARKLNGDFFPSPQIQGTFAQGSSPNQVIFTPNAPFAPSTKVKVMVHGEFADVSNQQLGKDYYFGFTTSLPENTVSFSTHDGGVFPRLTSLPVGTSTDFAIETGSDVATDGTVVIYKADLASLLKALTYKQTTDTAS